jgi:RNA polymerase sigma factor (TIGR02999 family)
MSSCGRFRPPCCGRSETIPCRPGDLVNEAVLRLIKLEQIEWTDKSHFLALSARAMRRILIDHARKKNSDKRYHHKVTLVTRVEGVSQRFDMDLLEKSLIRLGVIDPDKAEIVELRYFGGMSLQEIAEVVGASESTVKRQWRVARAWLLDAMTEEVDVGSGYA